MVKLFHLGNGGAYMSKSFQEFYDAKVIKRELIAPYTPLQNGVAEHLNCTIQERFKSMLTNVELSNGFWAEVLVTAIHLINRLPTND